MDKSVFFSTDVETDGPIPGPHSMLSIGSAAFSSDGKLISTFSVNLETIPGASPDPSTAKWWEGQPEAWKACRKDLVNPEIAMKSFISWVKSIGGKPVFVAYPAGFDFMWVYWYMIRFAGESPFSFSALDIKTYAATMLKCPYRDATKRNLPKRWYGATKHNHIAVDDAKEQGEMFMNMYMENMKP